MLCNKNKIIKFFKALFSVLYKSLNIQKRNTDTQGIPQTIAKRI